MDISIIIPAILLHLIGQRLKAGRVVPLSQAPEKARNVAVDAAVDCFVNHRPVEHSHYLHYLIALGLTDARQIDATLINNAFQSELQEIEYLKGSLILDEEVLELKAANAYLLDRYYYSSGLN